MSRSRPPGVARRRLRNELRRLREEAGLTQQDVAEALDWSLSKVIRIETGKVAISISDCRALLTEYEVSSKQFDELVELARIGRAPTVSTEYSDVLPTPLIEWLEFEAYADVVRQYETKLIPGPLQTREYALSVIGAYTMRDLTDSLVIRRADARISRGRDLAAADGPVMEFIIDEAALRRGVGNEVGARDFTVMIEQLKQLQRLNTAGRRANGEVIEEGLNPNISIQVVPLEIGAYSAMRGPFELLEFKQDDNMVFTEYPNGDVVLRETFDRTDPFFEEFAELGKSLSGPAETNKMIDVVIRLMTERTNGIPAAGSAKGRNSPVA
jgi:transcriptional regulator with XRE-family HTH domain